MITIDVQKFNVRKYVNQIYHYTFYYFKIVYKKIILQVLVQLNINQVLYVSSSMLYQFYRYLRVLMLVIMQNQVTHQPHNTNLDHSIKHLRYQLDFYLHLQHYLLVLLVIVKNLNMQYMQNNLPLQKYNLYYLQ